MEEGDGIFLSTPSARRATCACPRRTRHAQFLSTPSARRATRDPHRAGGGYRISIHALREEGDAARRLAPFSLSNFYPRPPRGGRRRDLCVLHRAEIFLSTPSARRATEAGVVLGRPWSEFLSTPSARRATEWQDYMRTYCEISIHALREEGDYLAPYIPAEYIAFLSTPSARRATAKTETKSLFSYKLYNILHEFRRALIYNGSKNYPNHAKRLENPVRRCRKDAENSPFAPGRKTQNNSRPSCSKGG